MHDLQNLTTTATAECLSTPIPSHLKRVVRIRALRPAGLKIDWCSEVLDPPAPVNSQTAPSIDECEVEIEVPVFVEMEQGERKFIVTSDGTQSDLQRDALLAAAARRGMKIVLPTAAALAKANINGTDLSKTPSSTLVSLAAGQDGEVTLVGRLVWNDRDLGWRRSGRSIGPAGSVAGGVAASRSMKPFGAASVAALFPSPYKDFSVDFIWHMSCNEFLPSKAAATGSAAVLSQEANWTRAERFGCADKM